MGNRPLLAWRALERDASERSNESYRRILDKLGARHREANLSEFNGRRGTEFLCEFLAAWIIESRQVRGIDLSAATRSNIISVLHSFFGWAESEDLIEVNPKPQD